MSRREEAFLARWSRRKLQERAEKPAQPPRPAPGQAQADDRLPPLESLDENADYSPFLAPNVSESLRRLALGRLFHSAGFNVTDGLDDYAEDFTAFAGLGDLVTEEMRRRMAQALETLAEPGAEPSAPRRPPSGTPDGDPPELEPAE